MQTLQMPRRTQIMYLFLLTDGCRLRREVQFSNVVALRLTLDDEPGC
jgi:hypothetical protein